MKLQISFTKIVFFVIVFLSHSKQTEIVVKIKGTVADAKLFARQNNLIYFRKVMNFNNLYILYVHRTFKHGAKHYIKYLINKYPKVKFILPQTKMKRVSRNILKYNDPYFKYQWHLQRHDKSGMNIEEVWNMGISGKGIIISILDDGVDYNHPDLLGKFVPEVSYDFLENDMVPLSTKNGHGTKCAGVALASANNSYCGVGVAHGASLGVIRLIFGYLSDRIESEGLSVNPQKVHIYSGSWGPDDSGSDLDGPRPLAEAAMKYGVKHGRNSLGNIYVWASGNGGIHGDSCACDGYVNSIYTIPITSVSEHHKAPQYTEKCASLMAATFSGGDTFERQIVTIGNRNSCHLDFSGTSASAPIAAGIIALLLEANSKLTWRDVQYIIVLSSNSESLLKNGNFFINGAGFKVSSTFGFGLMDALKMIRLSRVWINVPQFQHCTIAYQIVNRTLHDKFQVASYLNASECTRSHKPVKYVEYIILRLRLRYDRRGALRIIVTSPSGTKSELLPYRYQDSHSGYTHFDMKPLSSVQFWGEESQGIWKIEVDNLLSHRFIYNNSSNLNGFWDSVKMEITGTNEFPIRLDKSLIPNNEEDWYEEFEKYSVKKSTSTVLYIPYFTVFHSTLLFIYFWSIYLF